MKKLFIVLGVLLFIIVLALRIFLYPSLPILNGFAAKALCSCVFVAGIPEDVAREDEAGFFPISLASTKVDYDQKMTSATLLGMVEKRAYYREGQGCAIFNELEAPENRNLAPDEVPKDTMMVDDTILSSDQKQNLNRAIDWAFTEDDPENPAKRTRGVAIMHKGKLVAERYAEGFGPNSRMLGWSMTKSVTSTMAGLMIRDGYFSLNDLAPVEEWSGTDKEAITYQNLLQMGKSIKIGFKKATKTTNVGL